MRRLISDIFIRHLAQFLLIGILFSILILQTSFSILVMFRSLGEENKIAQKIIMSILKFPFEQEFASLTTVVGGVVPIVFSVVCFSIGLDGKATDVLNLTGRIVSFLLTAGILIGMTAIGLAGLNQEDIDLMAGGASARIAIRNFLAAILAFQMLYVVQLVGLKK